MNEQPADSGPRTGATGRNAGSLGLGMVVGIVIGILIFDNIPIGIAFGIAIGIAFGIAFGASARARRDTGDTEPPD